MLFYSGRIRHMGEVHLGNTVTDYMEQERNRGKTIFVAQKELKMESIYQNDGLLLNTHND
jgi:translation elongation factor EF-G